MYTIYTRDAINCIAPRRYAKTDYYVSFMLRSGGRIYPFASLSGHKLLILHPQIILK